MKEIVCSVVCLVAVAAAFVAARPAPVITYRLIASSSPARLEEAINAAAAEGCTLHSIAPNVRSSAIGGAQGLAVMECRTRDDERPPPERD